MNDENLKLESFKRSVKYKLKEMVIKMIEEDETDDTKIKLFSNDFETIKQLLEDNPQVDVNMTDQFGETPLFRAIYLDNLEVAQLLYEHGADLNFKNKSGETILYITCLGYGDIETIDWLLEHGADANITDINGKTAADVLLSEGAYEHAYDIIETLIKHNAEIKDPNRLLTGSCILNKLELAQKAIELGADIDNTDWEGDTPLIFACRQDSIDIINMLLEKGADVNARSSTGMTALMNATLNNDFDTVKLLVEKGADIDAVSDENKTALSFAFNDEIREYLKQHQTDKQ